jgi:hypothetical protein
MKKVNTIFVMILFVMAGCGGCKPSGTHSDDFITVDVTASYPKKELVLQDFMDVEYIPLETTDEFLCQGLVQDIGKDIIVARNRVQDGNIFIFDRKGKAIKKINRRGQGSEEYANITGIALDEDNGEIFVSDGYAKKIAVYDTDGNFKRSFKHKEGAWYTTVYNFDRENLICHDNSTQNKGQSFIVISKQDGSITKDIQIPFEEKKLPWLIAKANGMTYALAPSCNNPIVPYLDGWILVEPSADTLYRYFPDHTMMPFIVKTPPVRSLDPEIWLFIGTIVTDRYCFMAAVKKEGDAIKQTGLPTTNLMYDKQEKAIFKYAVYNDDYSTKEYTHMIFQPVNNEIATWSLEAHQLIESYGKGELKGKLKEIAAELDEDSNPVIMLIKLRNKNSQENMVQDQSFITVLNVTNLYINDRNNGIKVDATLETIDVSVTDSEMHGRPLLYNSTLGYKCQNFSGTDCGAVCQ